MLPATYLGMRRRRRPFVLWASVWAHPRGSAKAALGFPLVRHVYRHADAVVAYGPHTRRYVARYRGHDDDVVVAPQSVEAGTFGRTVGAAEIAAWRAEAGLGDGPLVLLVGRLVPEKGVASLLDAWRRLPAAHGATLVAIGDGPLAAELAATPGARLLGPLPRERLPVAYAAAGPRRRALDPDAAASSSRGGSSATRRSTRARPSSRRPRSAPSPAGSCAHEETGLVVAPGDPAALAAALERLLVDDSLRTRLGATARAAVAAHTYGAMADAFGHALARAASPDAARPVEGLASPRGVWRRATLRGCGVLGRRNSAAIASSLRPCPACRTLASRSRELHQTLLLADERATRGRAWSRPRTPRASASS